MAATLLSVLREQFFLLRSTVRHKKTKENYERAVRWLGEMLGRDARLSDLTDDHLAALLKWLSDNRGQSINTVNGSHKCISCLWRWARDRGLVSTGPTVRPIKAPQRAPRAWRREELKRLVETAKAMPGSIYGYPASVFFVGVLAVVWDTGMRCGELLSLRWEWLNFQTGWIHVPGEFRKGGRIDGVYRLLPDTLAYLVKMAKLAHISHGSGLVFGCDGDRGMYWKHWDRLLRAAGLPTGRQFKTQCLRRSFGSWLEIGGGSATDALGHSSRAITVRSYIDPTLSDKCAAERLPFRILEDS